MTLPLLALFCFITLLRTNKCSMQSGKSLERKGAVNAHLDLSVDVVGAVSVRHLVLSNSLRFRAPIGQVSASLHPVQQAILSDSLEYLTLI